MILDSRDILKRPVISEKSYGLLDENKYTFLVRPDANKTQIKIAVEQVFGVKVTGVHLLVPDQLNTYDVLVSDDVVFTRGAFDTFVAGPAKGKTVKAVATSSEADSTTDSNGEDDK